MRERIDGVEEVCSDDLVTTVSSKISQKEWNFTLHSSMPLRAVALLQDAHRNHFVLRSVKFLLQLLCLVISKLNFTFGCQKIALV